MFFVVSKIFFVLLVPLNWVVVLLTWQFVTKNPRLKKRLLISAFLVLLIFGNEFLLTKLVNAWQPSSVTLPANASYSAGIILGGYESYDRFGNRFFNYASDRFIQTVKLYQQGHIKKIVVSGSRVVNFKVQPSSFIQTELLKMGVLPEDILVDDLSKNTFENAKFSHQLLDSAGLVPPYIMITSALHVPRAAKVFRKEGIEVIPYPCNYAIFNKSFEWDDYFWPKSFVLDQWPYYLKEVIGTFIYKLTGKA